MLIAGVCGGARMAAVALAEGPVQAVCAQERVLRVRGAGVNPTGLPDEALDLLLQKAGRSRRDIGQTVIVDAANRQAPPSGAMDHHFAHACTAYLTSPFQSATVVVCDHEAPGLSVFTGQQTTLVPLPPLELSGNFAAAYSRCAAAFGFDAATGDQSFEALARLRPGSRDAEADRLIMFSGAGLVVDPALERRIAARLSGDRDSGSAVRASLAASLEARIAEVLVEVLKLLRARLGSANLCLGGSLFYHSSINTLIERSRVFDHLFVPVDPGNSGLAVGAAAHALGARPAFDSPFLGPCYSSQEAKDALDNCKLQYAWEAEDDIIAITVDALRQGYLVGWFDGAMEWGHRALGARCILANPQAPYVLENLNRFLKRREEWRGYAVSGLHEVTANYFGGPASAAFMQYDYQPNDPAALQHVLPRPEATLRVHTVAANHGLPRFRRLLEAFGGATGFPFLVNTSFNGFHEPIVCSPRDAIRVFYGTGLDVLVLNQFVLRK
jgi:carbamoyltransferase